LEKLREKEKWPRGVKVRQRVGNGLGPSRKRKGLSIGKRARMKREGKSNQTDAPLARDQREFLKADDQICFKKRKEGDRLT